MRVIALFSVIVLIAAMMLAQVAEATTKNMVGIQAGCVFTKTLLPYQGPSSSNAYNTSAVFLNTVQEKWNDPILLYNGPGPYAFLIPVDTAAAGVIGTLAPNTDLEGLQNSNAFSKPVNYNQYVANPAVGSTYYGFASAELGGSFQFAFQVKSLDQATGAITIEIGAFMINSVVEDGSNCIFQQRKSTLTRMCSGKFAPVSMACGEQ